MQILICLLDISFRMIHRYTPQVKQKSNNLIKLPNNYIFIGL